MKKAMGFAFAAFVAAAAVANEVGSSQQKRADGKGCAPACGSVGEVVDGLPAEHVAIEVKDPEAMAKWWCENLGFRVTLRRKGGSMFIADAAGRLAFEIYPPAEGKEPVDYRKMPYLQLHFGLTSNDVDTDTKRLLAAGATFEAKDDAPGLYGVMFRDPQGIPFQIMKREKSILR